MRDDRVYASQPRSGRPAPIQLALPEWYESALCAQTDPEGFYPEAGRGSKTAKSVCQDCPVRTKCLRSALENDERYGVWGGLTRSERLALLKKERRGARRSA